MAAKVAVDNITPYQVTFGRWAILTILLFTFYRRSISEVWSIVRPNWIYVVLMGGIGFVMFNILFYHAGHRTTAVNIGILQGSIPIFVIIGTFLLYKNKLRWVQIVGVALGFFGVAIVSSRGAPHLIRHIEMNSGDAMMIVACIVWASYTIGLRNRPKIPGLILFAIFCVPAAIASIPFVIYEIIWDGAVLPTRTGWLVLVYTTLFPSFLAQLFFLRGVDLMGPEMTGLYVNLTPIFAAFLAIVILNESFQLYHAIALLLVLVGLWLARERVSRLIK